MYNVTRLNKESLDTEETNSLNKKMHHISDHKLINKEHE